MSKLPAVVIVGLAASIGSSAAGAQDDGSRSRQLSGVIRSADGQPITDALVAVVAPEPGADEASTRAVASARSGADGQFRLSGLPPGPLTITATHPAHLAGVAKVESEDAAVAVVTLGKGGARISGRVRVIEPDESNSMEVRAHRYSDDAGVVFYARSRSDGTYAMVLPPGTYLMLAVSDSRGRAHREVEADRDRQVDLELIPERPVPDVVTRWIRETAVPLASDQPSADMRDLARVRSLFADVQLVGLGEATHGSREFVRLWHRLFEFLADDMGYTVLALEGSFAGGEAARRYVQGGIGTAREAVHSLRVFESQEILDLVEWVRAANSRRQGRPLLQIAGVDINPPGAAARAVMEAVADADKLAAAEIKEAIRVPLDDRTQFDLPGLGRSDQDMVR